MHQRDSPVQKEKENGINVRFREVLLRNASLSHGRVNGHRGNLMNTRTHKRSQTSAGDRIAASRIASARDRFGSGNCASLMANITIRA